MRKYSKWIHSEVLQNQTCDILYTAALAYYMTLAISQSQTPFGDRKQWSVTSNLENPFQMVHQSDLRMSLGSSGVHTH